MYRKKYKSKRGYGNMNIAIVDGNKQDTKRLHDVILHCQELFHNNLKVDIFRTGEDLLDVYSPRKFDIIFLDVHLEGINGIETVEHIRMQDKVSKIVFLTDSPEYAITAFRLRAFHYLLKPFQEDEIQSLLYECTAQLPDTRQYILVKEGHFEKKIFCRDIDYAVSSNHYIHFYTRNGIVKTAMSFSGLLELMKHDKRFLECNRGVLVNMDAIEQETSSEFLLKNGEILPIRVRDKNKILTSYSDYIFEKKYNKLVKS